MHFWVESAVPEQQDGGPVVAQHLEGQAVERQPVLLARVQPPP